MPSTKTEAGAPKEEEEAPPPKKMKVVETTKTVKQVLRNSCKGLGRECEHVCTRRVSKSESERGECGSPHHNTHCNVLAYIYMEGGTGETQPVRVADTILGTSRSGMQQPWWCSVRHLAHSVMCTNTQTYPMLCAQALGCKGVDT